MAPLFDRRAFHRGLSVAALSGVLPGALAAGGAARAAGATPYALPSAADTIVSPRSVRPEALGLIDAFHANRAEWHYATSPDFVAQMRAHGIGFVSGTINSTDVPGADVSVGLDGTPNIAPWMKGWGKPFVTSASPRTQAALAAWVQRNLDAGVDAIVFDDMLPLASAETWAGGDFSPQTQALFAQWLVRHPQVRMASGGGLPVRGGAGFRGTLAASGINDVAGYKARRADHPMLIAWRNFLLDLDIAQIAGLRSRTYQRVAHPMFSGNLNTPHPGEQAERLMPMLDYFSCEINSDDILDVYIAAQMLAAHGKPLVASSQATSNNTLVIQRSVAAGFAAGALPLVPWDVYVPPHSRYFAQPADFLPIFDFFRRHSELLTQWRYLPVLGVVFSIGQTPMPAFRSAVDLCTRWGVPFRVITCGGEMTDRPIRARDLDGLKGVIDPAPGGSLSAANVALVGAAGLPLGRGPGMAGQMSTAFFADPACQWCAIRRHAPDGRAAWFIVARKYGAPPIAPGTRLTIMTENPQAFMAARLIGPDGVGQIGVQRAAGGVDIVLPTIGTCAVLIA